MSQPFAPRPLVIAPSILASDFSKLGEEVRSVDAAGADWIHLDVMDGHFVPNLTIGPAVVAAVRRVTVLPLDVHLMVSEPDRFLETFARAGAAVLTVHAEVLPHLHRTIQAIKQLGCRAGVAINPSTPPSALAEVAGDLDLVLVMSVNPGFGGQAFIPGSPSKIARVRELLDRAGNGSAEIEVDGGVDLVTVDAVVRAGATVVVAGAAVYGGSDPEAAVRALKVRALAAAGARP
jgi:ribulose-phosphate 3-epimerase